MIPEVVRGSYFHQFDLHGLNRYAHHNALVNPL